MRTKCFWRLLWKAGNVLKEKTLGGSVNSATSVVYTGAGVILWMKVWTCSQPGVMFVLVEMVDTVRIAPWDFQRQINEAIAEELNKKLANKVCFRNAYKTFIYQFGNVTPLLNNVLLNCDRLRWSTTWACASACMTSLNWRIPTFSRETELLIPKVRSEKLY